MHDLQKILLKRLLGQSKQRYASLARGYDYDDNIVFHLRQLTAKELISKNGQEYAITAKGVKEITKYDLSGLADTGFKTFFVGFVCEYQGRFLIKEHPAGVVNFYNLPSGKPQFGEQIDEALSRILFERTGIKLGTEAFTFRGLHLKTVKTSAGEVLFDDAFAVYDVALDEKSAKGMKLAGTILWADVASIQKLPNRWPEIDLCILQDNRLPYQAYEFTSDYILG